jgi:hypothetical protein
MSVLSEVKLTDEQQEQFKKKLDGWKMNERKKMENELTEKYELMEAQLKDEYEDLVADIKENMKKVYTKRFTQALKDMYEEIRAEVKAEQMQSSESSALEEVKAIVYPLINESTAKRHRNEFAKLAEMYEDTLDELEKLKGEIKKSKLVESLSPDVRKVVTKLLGEGTEEEIVERFAEIKKSLKESQQLSGQGSSLTEDEDYDEEDEDYDEYDENDDSDAEDEEDNEEDYDEEIDASSSIEDEDFQEETDPEFEKMLNEQLVLAGIKKQK